MFTCRSSSSIHPFSTPLILNWWSLSELTLGETRERQTTIPTSTLSGNRSHAHKSDECTNTRPATPQVIVESILQIHSHFEWKADLNCELVDSQFADKRPFKPTLSSLIGKRFHAARTQVTATVSQLVPQI